MTFPQDKSIEIYVRDGDSAAYTASILAHELGHAFDVEHMNSTLRDDWLNLRGRSDATWWPNAYASDFETGAGDFAEIFAVWAIGDKSDSRLAGAPNGAQIGFIDSLMRIHV